MKENVGGLDRALRWVGGPLLAIEGHTRLGGRSGRLLGLAGVFGGRLLFGTALTGVCPVNALLGRDTSRVRVAREARDRLRVAREAQDVEGVEPAGVPGARPGARPPSYEPEARVQDRV